jgi:N-hydroxyarylamine O-acetyltransferase
MLISVLGVTGFTTPRLRTSCCCLQVEVGNERWLADVGFGRFAVTPVPLASRAPHADRFGTFALVDTPDGDIDVHHDGRVIYRFETRPRERASFAPHCWYHCTSPESSFTRSALCSRVTPTGRVTISGDRLILTSDGGDRSEETLPESELLAAYAEWFGIELDAVPVPLHPKA